LLGELPLGSGLQYIFISIVPSHSPTPSSFGNTTNDSTHERTEILVEKMSSILTAKSESDPHLKSLRTAGGLPGKAGRAADGGGPGHAAKVGGACCGVSPRGAATLARRQPAAATRTPRPSPAANRPPRTPLVANRKARTPNRREQPARVTPS
jgi:hypothetical protein